MKKWKNLSNPADPSIWADVGSMWPTGRGTYESADQYTTTNTLTATNEEGDGISAWVFRVLGGYRAYYFGKYLWELNTSLASPTDRTGALGASAISTTTGGHACQYGNVTIVTRGTGASLIYSTGGNFAALAGSPSARFVVSQSNAVVAFNTSANSDEWVASDVGDYTNWSTGEYATGRILEGNGPITGACVFGNDILVFKEDSIHRMTYVGGQVKWQIQKVWQGIGLFDTSAQGGSACVATSRGVFFCGGFSEDGTQYKYYLFDGSSPPYCVNMENSLNGLVGTPVYFPKKELVTVYTQDSAGANWCYYYSLLDDAWGVMGNFYDASNDFTAIILRGEANAMAGFSGYSPSRPFFVGGAAGTNSFANYYRLLGPGSAASSCYIQTHKIGGGGKGKVFGKEQTRFGPAAPVLRRRSPYSAGSPALALTVDTYTELHDTTAAATASVAESTLRDRFDFVKSDTFCQLKLTATDTDIEIDDISVEAVPAGEV